MALDQARGDAVTPEQPLPRRGDLLRRHRAAIAAPAAYLVGAVWLYWPLVRHLRSAQMGGPDTSLFTWWLAWTPYAIGHGHSPLLTTWINAPHGVNTMWNTSVPLLGVLMAPVTETLGPVASVNLLLVAAPALSAWSAFLAGRWLGLRARSAFLVGFLYGFSSNVIAENSSGHLHLSFAVFPPLVAALLAKIIGGRLTPRAGGLLLGAAAALQVWTGEEMLATSGILALLSLVVLALRAPRDTVRAAAAVLARTVAWAMLVAVPLTLPALLAQFFGAGRLTSGVPINAWSTDLLGAITPTRQTYLGDLVSDSVKRRVQMGVFDEIVGYVGLPLVVLLIASRRRMRESALHWCWAPLLVAGVLAIGWGVRLGGLDLHIPGPQRLTRLLPLLDSMVGVRFSLYVLLFAALLAGAAWDSAQLAVPRARTWTAVLVALAVVAVLPRHSARITRIHDPAAFASGRLLPGVPSGSTLAVLPWPNTIDASAMRWTAVGRLHYKLLGAWGIVAGPQGQGEYGAPSPGLNRVVREIADGNRQPPLAGSPLDLRISRELADLARRAQTLVIGPYTAAGRHGGVGDPAPVAAYVGRVLHQHPQRTGGVYLFHLP